jgi:hypothetical protein
MTADLVPWIGPQSPGPARGGLVIRRCNPYGHGTDAGPRHLIGGLYGPQHEGRYKWECANPATVRVRMTCRHGHRGQVMDLCRPHAREIQRRQAGLCPACAWPPRALELHEAINSCQAELAVLHAAGLWHGPRAAALRSKINSCADEMTEMWRLGLILKIPLTLTEVS